MTFKKKLTRYIILLVAIFAMTISSYSATKKIGLVLSGGGAKGYAHIGVLRELEKNNIKVDYISGTSSGALIAALYSVGYTPDEIEQILYNSNISSVLAGKIDRRNVPLEQKINSTSAITALRYDNKLNLSLPKAISDNNLLYLAIKSLLWRVEGITDFNKLPIPLRIVAANLNTGKAVTFDSGDLARIVTASMAIPGVYDPVRIGGDYYVDGMIMRNFPVQDIKLLNPDFTIGSNVGAKLENTGDYNVLNIITRITAIYSATTNEEEEKLVDVLITPDVSKYSATDFNNITTLVDEGQKATANKMPTILAKLKSKNITMKKSDTQQNNIVVSTDSFIYKNIVFEKFGNEKKKNYDKIKLIIEDTFEKYKEKEITDKELESIFKVIHAQSYIYKIYYRVDKETGTLFVDFDENLTNSLDVAANYSTDYGTSVKLSTSISSIGTFGSLTNAYIKGGDYFGAGINSFTYYGNSNKVGVFYGGSYNEAPLYIFNEQASKQAKYLDKEFSGELGLATQLKNKVLASYGATINSSELSLDTGKTTDKIALSSQYETIFTKISYDTLDNLYFPKVGTKSDFIYTWGGVNNDSNVNYNSMSYALKSYYPATKNISLYGGISGGALDGEKIMSTKYFKIGGYQTNLFTGQNGFAGYALQNILAKKYLITNFGINYQIYSRIYLLAQYDFGTFEQVNMIDSENHLRMWSQMVSGPRAGISYDSFIGPVSLFLSENTDTHEIITQFNIGYYLD